MIDESAQWTPSPKAMASKSKNSPFDERQLQGKVKDTFVNGEAVVLDGEAQR